jgi:hypothetical protein
MRAMEEHRTAAARRLEEVRRRCLEAALAAWEDAGVSGLCADGRWECVVRALREVPLDDLEERSPG